ncbi:MAG: NADPH:quinone reductase [Trebonia sp.]|jgi:NADPH2:quinone reductase|nr:NADPH:quinone reductase [Trebonia sp.]
MRAIVVSELGGPEAMVLGERADPVAGPGQVVVEVAAAGVNFIDVYRRSGVYKQPVPYVPGSEGAGTVVAAGEGVHEFSAGDHVAWCEGPGSYAERVAVAADQVMPVPGGIDLKVAGAVVLQGLTAHYLCHSTFPVAEGTVAVVHAAAGGVGLLLTQMIKDIGGTVVATTSSTPKAVLAKQAGADFVTTYAEFPAVVREVTGGRGADVVFDGVGKDTFDASLSVLRPRGMMVLFGGSSGQVPPLDPQRLNSGGSLYLTRPTLANYVADRPELLWRAGDIFERIAKASLHVRIGADYPLADAPRAHEDLTSRRTTGKLLLLP